MTRWTVCLLLVLFAGSASAQGWNLTITGKVDSSFDITPAGFASLPHATVTGMDHQGHRNRYSGVPLSSLLHIARVPQGDSLRGRRLLLFVQAEALDGYRVIFALPEADTAFTDNCILVADSKNGAPLDAKEGPLQVIVPGEKMHARWIRQLRTLRIRDAAALREN